jgi:hypothetical protein
LLKLLFAKEIIGLIVATYLLPATYKLSMSKTEIPPEMAKALEYIEDKYDIFFRANNKQLSDYYVMDRSFTLTLREGNNLPFTLINELKTHFQVER